MAVGANALNDNERIVNAILTNGRTSRYPEFYSREWAQSVVDRMDADTKAAAVRAIDNHKRSDLNTELSKITTGAYLDNPSEIDTWEETRRRKHMNNIS